MKKLLFYTLLGITVFSPVDVDAASVRLRRNVLTFTEETTEGKITMQFSKCMANTLFTFSSIKLDDKYVNQTSSDNIGPFWVEPADFIGGNHTDNSGKRSAKTISFTIAVDGKELTADGTYEGKVVTIDVKNELYYPDGKKFCDENIFYTVSGNSIDVVGNHEFTYPSPLTVKRYYGAQSMFPATELLLAGTNDNKWVSLPPRKFDLFVHKSTLPTLSTFVEHCADGYQAVYKYNEGIGDASFVADDGEIFLFCNYGAATGKSYHVMMWDHPVKTGDKTKWHAMYSWFKEPVEDTFRSGDANPVFKYNASINGQDYIMNLDSKGKMTSELSGIEDVVVDNAAAIASVSNNTITVHSSDANCYDVAGKLMHSGSGSFTVSNGIYVVTDCHGNSVKLLVK